MLEHKWYTVNGWSLIKSGRLFCRSQGPVFLFEKLQESWETVSLFIVFISARDWDIVKDAVLCFLPLPSYVP